MDLSNDLISQFVKMTNDKSPTKGETTVYGTAVDNNGKIFVKIDGSDIVTPVNTITDVKSGERVIVTIKNHSATITGNASSPSARTDDVKEVKEEVSNVKVLVADKASIGDLEAESARIDNLVADNVTIKDNLTASNADIDSLKASNVEITEKLTANEADISKLKTDKLDASAADIKYATIENLEATNAEIHNLDVTYGEFKDLTTDKLTAIDASIDNLETNKLSATDADIKYANIDFANIGEAAIENFYAKSGVIQDVVISDGQVTGTLVGVTIKGDLIEGGTVVADKLVIKGEDGLYYKLNTNGETVSSEQTEYNSLSGTIITAKSVTAEKIAVDDLVAFDATIGGFNITDKAIYSGVKNSVDNTTRGIYLDKDGQAVFGDATNFLKYYKDQNGNYKLEISADSISFGSEKKSVETAINELSESTTANTEDLTNFISATNSELENLQGQIDGSITTWFYDYEPTVENAPASDWATTDLKNNHLGDLFYDTVTGYCYRWQVQDNTYSWSRITDVDVTKALSEAANAQDTADSKRRVFVDTPTPPYDVGDLWVQDSDGDILRCKTAKTSSQSYASSDWVKASKYTDDTAANAAQDDVDALKTRVTTAETNISQNSEAIELRATKKELETTNSNVTKAQDAADGAQADIDNLTIGGRNLLINTNEGARGWGMKRKDGAYTIARETMLGVKGVLIDITEVSSSYSFIYYYHAGILFDKIQPATEYTISFDVWSSIDQNSSNISIRSSNGKNVIANNTSIPAISAETWTKIEAQLTTVDTLPDITDQYIYWTSFNQVSQIKICNLKLELGNKATDWSPAPEDQDSATQAVADDLATNYYTITETESAISVKADEITQSVGSTYTTKSEFNALDIGARNFILNSSEEKNQTRETTNTFIDYDFSSSLLECDSESFVISYDAKCETESDNMTCTFYFRDDSASIVNYTSKTLTANYARYSDILTFKEGYSIGNIVYTRFAINGGTGTVYVKNVKLESGNKVTDWTPAPEDVTSEIAAVNDTIHSQRTEIIEDCESIVLSAIETRVSSDEYAELRETVESQFTILSDEINMKFSENSEAINTVNGELNEQITNLYKHISFSENGIIIQSGENSVELQLDNDKGIIFSKNGQEFGSWDGTDFHTGNIVIEVNEKAQFGNFAFIPRTDGSMSFLKVKDRLLQIYQQPQDYTGAVGETAVFNITAYGENVTYQWQYRNTNASSWTKSSMTGSTTATLSVPIAEKRNGQQYRCIVSDAAGNQIISNSAVLHVSTEEGS